MTGALRRRCLAAAARDHAASLTLRLTNAFAARKTEADPLPRALHAFTEAEAGLLAAVNGARSTPERGAVREVAASARRALLRGSEGAKRQ